MMFLALGLTNALRQSRRTLLALLVTAFATAMIFASFTLEQGVPAGGWGALRVHCSGDIMLFRHHLLPSAQQLRGANSFQLDRLPLDQPGDGYSLFPDARDICYVTTRHKEHPLLPWPAETIDRLRAVAGVTEVHQIRYLPLDETTGILRYGVPSGNWCLRGRNLETDRENGLPEKILVSGRYFLPEEANALVAIVPGIPTVRGDKSPRYVFPYPVQSFGNDDSIGIAIPSISRRQDGSFSFDYSRLHKFRLTVVGRYAVPTRDQTF